VICRKRRHNPPLSGAETTVHCCDNQNGSSVSARSKPCKFADAFGTSASGVKVAELK
jgi:hypothetical protein